MGQLVDSSVIVPRGGDAATGTGGEARILNRLYLAAVCRGAIHWRFNGVDSVAIAVDVLDGVDGVA